MIFAAIADWPYWAQIVAQTVTAFLVTIAVIHIIRDWIMHPDR